MKRRADRRHRQGWSSLTALCGIGWTLIAVASSPTAMTESLQRMATAVNTLSFEGTLVYLHRNRLETLYLEHAIQDGEVRERLVSLTGPVRTVMREDDEVTCILPNSHPISVKRHGVAQGLLHPQGLDPDQLAGHYAVRPLGAARVAGRQTDVIGVMPRDELRYGYRFYIDQETGLPLKTDLLDTDAEPIEQVMFTTVRLMDSPPPVLPDTSATSLPRPTKDLGRWRFEQLPSGFKLIVHQGRASGQLGQLEHFLLSDGLAAISVYIEPDTGAGLDGETRIGAIHAAGGQIAGHRVTVVGEVPVATVVAVLAGIRPVAEVTLP